ncbi:MAG: type IV secretory system conjugative DNA transfer family protein [Eubacterium sp.]|nr:type IV secretory system conjugative DNA transfer family protein [Eubacterium sp.]
MSETQIIAIVVLVMAFIVILCFAIWNDNFSIDRIKARRVGDGQYGTSQWADKAEIRNNLQLIPYQPQLWRMGACLPDVQGIIIGCETHRKKTYAIIDTLDVHTMIVAAPGTGKTSYFLEPNIEYACAAGMSFLSTDSKGDIYRNCGYIAAKRYGYNISVLDLRNPMRSSNNNLLHLVNRYMRQYKDNPGDIKSLAKAEKYAKIIADSIITIDGEKNYGANTYFYDAAKGLIAAVILVLAEYGQENECHIVSVLKLMNEFLEKQEKPESSNDKQKNVQMQFMQLETKFNELMRRLPEEHKAKWLAGSAVNSADQTVLSTVSTALSRLNSFIDSEIEQILCFDTAIDAEAFCNSKSAIFIVLPEEDQTKHVIANLIIQQFIRELYTIADENGGSLNNRVMLYLDEFGTMPPFVGAEGMFTASRSRKISLVPVLQSFAQLQKNYGDKGSETILDTIQVSLYGGFSPNSKTPEKLSKGMGNQTVLSGTVSYGGSKNNSKQHQMTGKALMTADELKKMPRGNFICWKTGMNPMKVKLKLFSEWGITYDEKLILPDKEVQKVCYASADKILDAIRPAAAVNISEEEARKKVKPLEIFNFSATDEDPFAESAEMPGRKLRTI